MIKSTQQVNQNVFDLILAFEREYISPEVAIQALAYVYYKHNNTMALDAIDEILRSA